MEEIEYILLLKQDLFELFKIQLKKDFEGSGLNGDFADNLPSAFEDLRENRNGLRPFPTRKTKPQFEKCRLLNRQIGEVLYSLGNMVQCESSLELRSEEKKDKVT